MSAVLSKPTPDFYWDAFKRGTLPHYELIRLLLVECDGEAPSDMPDAFKRELADWKSDWDKGAKIYLCGKIYQKGKKPK